MLTAFKNRRGASILAVVIILAILAIFGAVFVSMFTTGVEQTTGEVNSTRALYAAEGGLDAAIGHLKKTPVATYWPWNDGYRDKPIGAGKADVEVLQYEVRDFTLAGANRCEPFQGYIKATGANPARTVFISLSWSGAANLGLELYDNTVLDCNNPTASANLIASPLAPNMPETIRYRIAAAPPATLNYTARVTGVAGAAYQLRISHPDETAFGSGRTCSQPVGPPYKECMRGLISIGKIYNARREIFAGFSRNP